MIPAYNVLLSFHCECTNINYNDITVDRQLSEHRLSGTSIIRLSITRMTDYANESLMYVHISTVYLFNNVNILEHLSFTLRIPRFTVPPEFSADL